MILPETMCINGVTGKKGNILTLLFPGHIASPLAFIIPLLLLFCQISQELNEGVHSRVCIVDADVAVLGRSVEPSQQDQFIAIHEMGCVGLIELERGQEL
jgi:hypothetical protein